MLKRCDRGTDRLLPATAGQEGKPDALVPVEHPLGSQPENLGRPVVARQQTVKRDLLVRVVAPGLDALLNDGFLEDHCFRLTSKDPRTVEVEFEPTRDRRQVTEVRGSASVDRATSELRRLEFRYVNASREIEDNAGGEMDFVQLRTDA